MSTGMRSWIRAAWRWSWLLTLPVALLFLYWGSNTLQRYATFGVRFDAGMFKGWVRLRTLGTQEFEHLQRLGRLLLDPLRDTGPVAGVRQISLFVPESALGELNAHLPQSGFDYVDAGLFHSGRLHRIKLRYRGDFLYHWYGDKKSLRIKTRKNDLYHGMRRFNLIVPKKAAQLNNYLGYRLAQAMELVTPLSELVELTLNGTNQGLYVLVEQLDESTLRRHGLMPGDLYAGELMAKDAYTGVDRSVFQHPGLWDKRAVNNHYARDSRKPLEQLLRLINAEQTPEVKAQLAQLLDIDAWGRFLAYITLAQSFHYDRVHNWRLYFDPARSRFVPVVWDPTAWQWLGRTHGTAVPDIVTSVLHERLYQNTDVLLARQRALKQFFDSGAATRFIEQMQRDAARLEAVLARDPNPIANDPQANIRAMNTLVDQATSVFGVLRQTFLGNGDAAIRYTTLPGNGRIGLELSGRQPLQRLDLQFERSLRPGVSARLRYWRNQQVVSVDISGAIRRSGARLTVEVPLLARRQLYQQGTHPLMRRKIRLASAYYELEIDGLAADNALVAVSGEWMNDTQRRAARVTRLARRSFDAAWPVVRPQPVPELQVWSGEQRVDGVREIRQPLLIKSGTTVYMGAGALLRIHDRVLVEGTTEHPVRFIAAPGSDAPWGAVVLNGPGANGSSLRHCEFSGGSGVKRDLFEYSGMLSIHDARSIQVEGCTFRDNREVDDMVHAVYAQVHFIDTRFERARADALDLDISEAVIERCSFRDTGNDAIDLMTTRAVVLDSEFVDSGDKGISVGEGSTMASIGNTMQGNSIGVQSKDGSMAVLFNTTLRGNAVSLDAYKKNWRYASGGRIVVYKSRIEGPAAGVTADKHSSIRFRDSYLSELPDLTGKRRKRIVLEPSVDTVAADKAATPRLDRYDAERKASAGLFAGYRDRIDPSRRGAHSDAN